MEISNELTPTAQRALKSIRALRKLPETSGTVAAERKVLKALNLIDTLAVALELDADDAAFTAENEGGR